MELAKRYEPRELEPRWQKFWEDNKIFKFNPKSEKPIYSIDTPPPYASSGHLHVGHALHYTQFELIARYKRMRGFNVYFPPCFDNNGLPTEKYVEEKFNISKAQTTRADFRKLCTEESSKVENAYADRFFKALGHSYDWDLLYTTINPEAQKVSQTSFVELVKQGDCYQAEEPTIWCTKHQTALAQAEVEDLSRSTKINHIYFDMEDGSKIEIATTRPEFLPACVGIFVHPSDNRYKHLVGKNAIVPLFGLKVPISTDENVQMDFGSGILMVCTFGDNADIDKWKRHKLPIKIIVTTDGKLNDQCGKYAGMSLLDGRKAIIEDLKEKGYFIKDEPIEQTVGSCWRCNTPVEFIVTKQWFIKALNYKGELIEQGRKIKWHPEFYRKRFEDWTTNLAWDWCISRQRFYGVPIPAWYCKKCNELMLPDKEDLPIDPTATQPKKKCKCGSSEFIPEDDVFDTWMTSSMSPEIAIRWLEKPEQFKKMFPVSLRPQSHDIIRTWAFYTILKAYLHFKSIPWENIAIGTFVLDPHGKGMHKSKGNVVWADELLKKYSVDVLRSWVGTATFGEDLGFQEKELVAGQRFLTKLWNASRFGLMHLEDYSEKPAELQIIDRWILTKLNKTIKYATDTMDQYKTGSAKREVEQFFWHTLCDNYLEVIKDRLYNPDKRGKEARASAQYALYKSILSVLKMLAPVVPHITEEIYQVYFSEKEGAKSIHLSDWPKYMKEEVDEQAEKAGDIAVDIVATLRRYKSEKNLSLKTPITNLEIHCETDLQKIVELVFDDIKDAAFVDNIKFGTKVDTPCTKFAIELGIELGEIEKKE
ncbi:valine--tRNA ligase [Candidatus Woesearchaeota archaeon]|nr:valine--tRNA ligase [Candidatus Woesearchaeota archaeon]